MKTNSMRQTLPLASFNAESWLVPINPPAAARIRRLRRSSARRGARPPLRTAHRSWLPQRFLAGWGRTRFIRRVTDRHWTIAGPARGDGRNLDSITLR